MDIRDYLIDQAGKDWSALLSDWGSLLPSSFTLWMVNRIGDAFVVVDDGSVHMLDVGIGQLKPIAESREQFADLVDIDDNANIWLAISLVDRCVKSGMQLSTGQCYGYKIPPLLGGTYEIDNFEPTDLSVHFGLLGSIFKQTRDLPDGTPIRAVVID
jgi:hypothetical protein